MSLQAIRFASVFFTALALVPAAAHLRRRWEYSHAASAILGLLALIAVVRALLAAI